MDENRVNTAPAVEEDVIVVKDGYKKIRIQNEYEEKIGEFYYNPTDVNIVNRYNEVVANFNDIVEPLENAGVNSDGTGTDEASIELINTAEAKLIEMLDYILRTDSRKAFFERTHAFSPVDGAFYCEQVIEAIGNFISAKYEKEINAISKNINRHTHGYRTGKHKKGDR